MPPALSVCMIVRDEEANLRPAIESVRAVASELVVVDTGSRDGTIALACSLGARVLGFPWADDFAAARNAALAAARGDWVLSLDADQRLDPASAPALERALACPAAAQLVHIDMLGADPLAAPVGSYPALRLFRRDERVRYRGRVHEDVAASLIELGSGDWPDSGVRLRDLGYADAETRRAKRARNLRLLQLSLREDPDNLFLTYKLAETLPADRAKERRGALARAVELACTLQAHQLRGLPFGHRLLAAAVDDQAAQGRLADAAALAVRMAPLLGAGSDFCAGRALARAGQSAAAAASLGRFLEAGPDAAPQVLLPDPAANRSQACRWLGWLAAVEGRAPAAQEWFARARQAASPRQALAIECDAVRVQLNDGDMARAAEGFARLYAVAGAAAQGVSGELMLLAAELSLAAGDRAGAWPLLRAARVSGDDRAEALLAGLALDGFDVGDAHELLAQLPGRRFDTLAARAALARRLGQPLRFALPAATRRYAAARAWALD